MCVCVCVCVCAYYVHSALLTCSDFHRSNVIAISIWARVDIKIGIIYAYRIQSLSRRAIWDVYNWKRMLSTHSSPPDSRAIVQVGDTIKVVGWLTGRKTTKLHCGYASDCSCASSPSRNSSTLSDGEYCCTVNYENTCKVTSLLLCSIHAITKWLVYQCECMCCYQ